MSPHLKCIFLFEGNCGGPPPSDVHKQVLCSLVDVEDLVSEQAEAGGALQGQLPQGQRRRVAVQRWMAQNETNCNKTHNTRPVKNQNRPGLGGNSECGYAHTIHFSMASRDRYSQGI